jgi:TRAP transporter TAXI family solute receptor
MHARVLGLVLLLGLGAVDARATETTMMTGKPSGTYIRFGEDIARVTRQFGLELKVARSAGSLENVEAVLKRSSTQFGIVQSDVLDFVASFSDDPELRSMASAMRMVFPLYAEEVHLLAKPEINSLADLQDKRVAVGSPTSGTLLTATLLLASAGVKPADEVEIDTEEALQAMRDGQVDAMFYVAGRPARLFSQEVTEADQLKLVPITESAALNLYPRSVIPARTYRWQPTDVPTVAVRAVLMTYDFSKPTRYHRQACAMVGKVARMIASNLDWLRRPGHGHPKWQEVDLDADLINWDRSPCAEAGLKGPDDYKIPAPQEVSCAAEANQIRRKLCLVKQQLRREQQAMPSASLM